MTSKAARIRALYAEGKTCKEIASLIGCKPEYVRVVARQRGQAKFSKADAAYVCKRYGTSDVLEAHRLRSRELYADPQRYARFLSYLTRWRLERRAESG